MIKQTKWLLRCTALAAAMLMLAASVALADPRECRLVDPNTLPPVELSNPPKPDADFLSSPEDVTKRLCEIIIVFALIRAYMPLAYR